MVLGKDARDVPAGQTRDYIFGYTILNDVSARDVQTAHKQWYFGKSLDGFTPIGPASSRQMPLPTTRQAGHPQLCQRREAAGFQYRPADL